MMKTFSILTITLVLVLTSCNKNEDSDPIEASQIKINNWIYSQMSVYYLWNEDLPTKPNMNAKPDAFFETLRNPADRFSWIQNNYEELLSMLSGVNNGELGFEYKFYRYQDNSELICGQVEYVKPNTPAHTAGIKRGDLFTKINGVQIKESNYKNLLVDVKGSFEITFVDPMLGNPSTKIISKVNQYAENPVYLDSVYNIGSKSIGYLVYNFFSSDNGDDSKSYDLLLNQIFMRFKSNNVSDLVLDLRYNSGGSMLSSTTLASMIVPDLNDQKVYTRLEYNSFIQSEIEGTGDQEMLVDRFMTHIEVSRTQNTLINNLGNLKTLYVLTGDWTASASEMVINGLKPYMKVVLIGSTTIGKNVGSFSIYEKNNPNNKWGMQPIVLRYFNSAGTSDFEKGFIPDVELSDNQRQKYELGNVQELLLQTAIQQITGKAKSARSIQLEGGAMEQSVGSSLENKPWSGRCIVDNRALPVNLTQKAVY